MKKKFLALVLAIMLIVSLIGCSGSNTDKSDNQSEKPAQSETSDGSAAAENGYTIEVLKLSGGDYGGPNPFRHSTRGPGSTKMRHVFDSLLESGTKGYIPWMAKEWSLSNDNLTYTFTLHDNITWHDGQPVTTEDVAFSIDYYSLYPNSGGNLFTADSSIIDSYEIIDAQTIQIKVTKALSTNTENVGTLPIIPKHIWENVDDPYNYDGDDKYIGCGMYKFVSYDPGTGSYQFEAYENYYGHKAAAHYIDYAPVSDAILAFENGDIVLTDVSADLYDAYAARDDISMIAKNDEMGFRLLINMERLPVFQDVKMRAALYQALNREKMVDAVFQGLGHVANAAFVPQTNRFYCDQVTTYDYDAAYAKSVLSPLNLSVRLVVGQDTPIEATLAEQIKMDLEAAGIAVSVESYDVNTRDSMTASGDYDLALTWHGGWNAEPVSMLTTIYGNAKGAGSKFISYGYTNKELMTRLKALPTIMDQDERAKLYDEIQLIIADEIPNLPLITQVSYAIYRPAEYDCWKAPFNFTQFAISRLSYTSDTNV